MNNNIISANEFVIQDEVLVKYIGAQKTVVIPKDIKKIGKKAFENSKIEEVIFESKSLQSIDEDAFKGCEKLKFVELPVGLVKIGKCAFYSCSELECAYIPASVLVIEANAFDSCASNFYIIGSDGSEAEKLSESKHCVFKNYKQALLHIKTVLTKRQKLTTKTFEIFGEEITTTNSLPLYHKVTERYDKSREKFVEEIVSIFPKNIKDTTEFDLQKIIFGQMEYAVQALEKEGVVTQISKSATAIVSD